MPQKIDVSHKTIIFITFFILTLWVTFLIRDLIVILFVAVIFVSALSPMVNFLIRLRLPKVLSIIITYIIIIAILSGLIISIIPPLITESNRLIVASPPLIAKFFNITNIDKSVFSSGVTSISKNLFSITIENRFFEIEVTPEEKTDLSILVILKNWAISGGDATINLLLSVISGGMMLIIKPDR